MFPIRYGVLLAALLLVVGCGTRSGPGVVAPASTGPSAAGKKFLLAEEPQGARGVLAVRESARHDEAVVVVGRIGGSVEPFVSGRAAFVLVDPSLKPCNEKGDDACTTPWDYCCDPPKELSKASVTVKVVDGGAPVNQDARELFGVRELQTVVVRGKVEKDESGKFVILADQLFVKK